MDDKRRQQLRQANANAVQALRHALSEEREVNIQPEKYKAVDIVFSNFESNTDSLLFAPLSDAIFEKHPVSFEKVEREPNHDLLMAFPDPPSQKSPTTVVERIALNPYQRALQLETYLEGQLFHLPRKNVDGFLSDLSSWDVIDIDHPFYAGDADDDYHLLSADGMRTSSDWETHGVYEYFPETKKKRGKKRPKPKVYPHLLLVTCHNAHGENGKLLRGELAALVEAIHNRSKQAEFANALIIPVFMISLFGPQHGRLLQAHFSSPQKLVVQASKCYSFKHEAEAPVQLFLSFLLSSPREVHMLQFSDWDDHAPGPAAGAVAAGASEAPKPLTPQPVLPSRMKPSVVEEQMMEPNDRDKENRHPRAGHPRPGGSTDSDKENRRPGLSGSNRRR